LNDYSRTPYTMTPEVASGIAKTAITDKADVWAVGVIAWVLLSGEFPFVKNTADLKDKDKMEALKKVRGFVRQFISYLRLSLLMHLAFYLYTC
jgi:serine/threonine protein kinase